MGRHLSIVTALDLPLSSLSEFETSLREAEGGTAVVVSTPIEVHTLEFSNFGYIISAPDLPLADEVALRAKVNDPATDLIVVNYPIDIRVYRLS